MKMGELASALEELFCAVMMVGREVRIKNRMKLGNEKYIMGTPIRYCEKPRCLFYFKMVLSDADKEEEVASCPTYYIGLRVALAPQASMTCSSSIFFMTPCCIRE